MSEYQEQWRLVVNAKEKVSNSNEGSFVRDFVNLIRFYLRSKSKEHIRNVVYQGIMDWEVLIMLGKLINHEVKLPDGFEKNDIINKLLSLDLEPISKQTVNI